MQLGSFGDIHILPRAARRPRARLRELAKPYTAAGQKELESPKGKGVVEPYDTDASAAQVDENAQSLPLSTYLGEKLRLHISQIQRELI
jgi:hypothetical protein